MKMIDQLLKREPEYQRLSQAVVQGQFPSVVTGVSGVHKCALVKGLAGETGKRILLLAGDESEERRFQEDLTALGLRTAVYPLRDFYMRDTAGTSHEYEHQRLHVLTRLQSGELDCVVACLDAALQYTMGPGDFSDRVFCLAPGMSITPEAVVNALLRCGYTGENQIDGYGQFSRRGGIIDFFSPGKPQPVRIEFFGDEIDAMSYFDTETQRRTDPISRVTVSPCIEVIPGEPERLVKKIRTLAGSLRGKRGVRAKEILAQEAEKLENGLHLGSMDKFISLIYEKPGTLFDYFSPEDSLLVFSETNKLKERVRGSLRHWGEDISGYLAEGILCKGLDQFSETWAYALSTKIPILFMDLFAKGSYEIPVRSLFSFSVKQLSAWGGSIRVLLEDLRGYLDLHRACVVLAGTEKMARQLASELIEEKIPASYMEGGAGAPAKGTVMVCEGTLSAGFEFAQGAFVLISHGKMSGGIRRSRQKKKKKNEKTISSLSDLSPGDYVVHSAHGIGIFEGIHKLEMNDVTKDYIKLRYAKMDSVYVPVTQMDLVSKYIGPREDSGVRLSRLGGTEWQKTKTRVRASVKDIAKELISLYAKRMQQKGFAFPEDNAWQMDFEGKFAFDETEDQLRCINEIKDDMEKQIPMDRLLCGDVGFGKTEVALRAIFKCVSAGKQCAFLVPTTILAWQHYQTLLRRFEGFDVKIQLLSRFRNQKQQTAILREMRQGDVDVVVGTHRLVSKDVRFRDLGLVIIDEEQRFGVAQKEKLKELNQSADFLTLSATPIPRTLNMALSKIRDMSVIEEAPHDRHPVQTYVLEYDLGMILDAIRKELRRGGQVYYLHNDVASIEQVAGRIRSGIPGVRIGIGHGKMDENTLNEVWGELIDGSIDVLVCTTIIETGVDVPNANTLIIDNADHMGLSQLHQLRGRVGRSSRRAYAYLTYQRDKSISELSQKRLSAIREFTEFGSGFKIAMRDLEIRGAGNILSGEQHGHMETVGYDMYIKLLNEAVALMKGEIAEPLVENCVVDVQVQAHIPESYISGSNLRLEIYRRIADIRTKEDAMDVVDELIDRFGDPPEAVRGLVEIALLRNTATALGIEEIKESRSSLVLYQPKLNLEQVKGLVDAMKGRVSVSAGSRPCINIHMRKGEPTLDLMSAVLRQMSAAPHP